MSMSDCEAGDEAEVGGASGHGAEECLPGWAGLPRRPFPAWENDLLDAVDVTSCLCGVLPHSASRYANEV